MGHIGQTLKRVYLYTAATFALLFTAAITIIFLNTLLNAAGMLPTDINSDGSVEFIYPSPTGQEVTQIVILFVITVVLVGGLFGGGHYWLIRRDARSDPGADGGATRHLFLNGLMALAALVGVPAGLAALSSVERTPGFHDPAVALAYVLVAAAVFAFVFLERGRAAPAGRAAPIIRQIQEDGVQAILLIIASAFFYAAVTLIFHYAFVTSGVVQPPECFQFSGPGGPTTVPCAPPPLLSPILAALFALASWGFYVWLGLWSRGAVLQRVLWYAAFGYGLVWLLYGVAQAIYTAFAPLFGDANTWQEALNGSLAFVGELLTGVLVTTPYAVWLHRLAQREPRLREASWQGVLAIPAALSAGFFLAGLSILLGGLVEQAVPAGHPPSADGWATGLGVLVAGLGYPVLWAWLRRVSDPTRDGPTIPRRVYVLVLLAGTAIGALVAAVFMAYQVVTDALGLAAANPQLARQSAVILVVLGAMALYHLWQLRADLRVTHARAAAAQPEPAQAAAAPADQAAAPASAPETLESILQLVAAGTLDPPGAAARIRRLAKL
jgi:hypothetical protein